MSRPAKPRTTKKQRVDVPDLTGDYSTRYPLTEKQWDEFYRLLFENGAGAARVYREQFGVKKATA